MWKWTSSLTSRDEPHCAVPDFKAWGDKGALEEILDVDEPDELFEKKQIKAKGKHRSNAKHRRKSASRGKEARSAVAKKGAGRESLAQRKHQTPPRRKKKRASKKTSRVSGHTKPTLETNKNKGSFRGRG